MRKISGWLDEFIGEHGDELALLVIAFAIFMLLCFRMGVR